MAVKSIIDIEINDGAFKRFAELFSKYQEQVKSTAGAWQKLGNDVEGVLDKSVSGVEDMGAATDHVADAAGRANVSFRQTFIAVSGQAAQLGKVGAAASTAGRFASSQAMAWHSMARDARSFAGHIGDATRSLLRWSALTGVISGILGGGGLFGIERLATSAANQRRSAAGLGVTPGEESAFNINYGRLGNSEGILQGVSSALLDITKRPALYGAGLTEGDIQGKNAAQVSAAMIDSLKRQVDQVPRDQLGNWAKGRQLGDLGIDANWLQLLKDRSPRELTEYRQQFQTDSRTLNLSNGQQEAWEKFKTQLTRAGASIENALITGLTPLAPALESLSAAFTKTVQAFLANPKIEEWITALGKALEGFAAEIAKPEFVTKINTFITDLGRLGSAIGEAFTAVVDWVKWFRGGTSGTGDPTADPSTATTGRGDITNPDDARVPGSKAQQDLRDKERGIVRSPEDTGGVWGWMKDRWYNGPDRGGAGFQRNDNTRPDGGIRQELLHQMSFRPGGSFSSADDRRDAFGALEGAQGLPPGLLSAVEKQESGGRDVTSSAGAQGYFQFMPATAARYGVNPHDEMSSAVGASQYYKDLLKRFDGNVSKALAGYNWGEGNVEKSVKQYGDQWRQHLPAETSNYVSSIERNIGSQQQMQPTNNTVKLLVQNATAGNAVISASQLS